jgi:glycosyltransferase involved in cell wall biosynthesis
LKTAKVTVIVPVYNQEKYLDECVHSLASQTYESFNVLLVNDGSTDSSLDVCRRIAIKDSRFQVLNYERNYGISFIRHETLNKVQSEYVAMLDSDDIALNTRLEQQAKWLDNHPETVVVGSFYQAIDQNRKILSIEKPPTTDMRIRWKMLFGYNIVPSLLMVRRDSALQCGGFNPTLRIGEDLEFFTRILTQGKIGVVPEVLGCYRMHPQNMMKTAAKEYFQDYHAIICSALSTFLNTDIDEEISWAASTHSDSPALSSTQFSKALNLLDTVATKFFQQQLMTPYSDTKLMGYTVFESYFKLMVRNHKETWWKQVRPQWIKSMMEIKNLTGHSWQDDWEILWTLHPRTLAWKTYWDRLF